MSTQNVPQMCLGHMPQNVCPNRAWGTSGAGHAEVDKRAGQRPFHVPHSHLGHIGGTSNGPVPHLPPSLSGAEAGARTWGTR